MDDNGILITDTTLRDGLQAPGVFIDLNQRLKTAEMLADAGINEIEAGIPAMGKEEIDFIHEIRTYSPIITSWCRAVNSDIEAAKKTGSDSVHISFPVSQMQLKTIDKKPSWVFRKMHELISLCLDYFERVSVGAQDASRCKKTYLDEFILNAADAGCWKIRIADTVGVAFPLEVFTLISRFNDCGAVIEFHAHNDLGMATANSVTAIDAGAGAVSGTLLGVGERAGNAALEEIVTALKLQNKTEIGVDITSLVKAAKHFSEFIGDNVPPRKAILGERIFDHQSGIHCAGILKNPLSYQPFEAADVAHRPERIMAGPYSGRNTVKHFLKKYCLPCSDEKVKTVLNEVKRISSSEKRMIEDSEIKEIYTKLYAN